MVPRNAPKKSVPNAGTSSTVTLRRLNSLAPTRGFADKVRFQSRASRFCIGSDIASFLLYMSPVCIANSRVQIHVTDPIDKHLHDDAYQFGTRKLRSICLSYAGQSLAEFSIMSLANGSWRNKSSVIWR